VLVSTLAGVTSEIPLRAVLTKGLTIKGSTLRSRTPAFKAELLAKLHEQVWPLLENGTIRPHIDRVLPMEQAAQAHAIMVRGEHTGKMILKKDED
jgi:NADPH2:quinone reductase